MAIRTLSAAGSNMNRLNIFNVSDISCDRPKKKRMLDPCTGEVIEEVQMRWEASRGSFLPVRCTSNSCWPCAVMNARRIAGAIQLSQPSHQFTMTSVPETSREIARQVVRVFGDARKEIPSLKYMGAAEGNPGENGVHLHGYVHASPESTSQIQTTLAQSISRITEGNKALVGPVPASASVQYFAYPMKSLATQQLFQAYLDLNGSPGRRMLVHASMKGFWRLGPGGQVYRRAQLESLALRPQLRTAT